MRAAVSITGTTQPGWVLSSEVGLHIPTLIPSGTLATPLLALEFLSLALRTVSALVFVCAQSALWRLLSAAVELALVESTPSELSELEGSARRKTGANLRNRGGSE